jgi:DNA-binding response OmpR family regulator
MDRLLAAGADDFLVKPIDVATFLDLVDRLLARARP